jgi:ubiquitin-protein ligase
MGDSRGRRLMKEIQDIRKDTLSGITIAPGEDESNLSHLSIVSPLLEPAENGR